MVDLTNCLNKSSKWDAIHPIVWKELESEIVKLWAQGVRWYLYEQPDFVIAYGTVRDTLGCADGTASDNPSIVRKRRSTYKKRVIGQDSKHSQG